MACAFRRGYSGGAVQDFHLIPEHLHHYLFCIYNTLTRGHSSIFFFYLTFVNIFPRKARPAAVKAKESQAGDSLHPDVPDG